ncbi:MAG: hypothetical protein ACK40M_03165 [Flavobacteriales bacterium]
MENSPYHSMKDLIQRIQSDLLKMEHGELHADALPDLVDDSRELYERLVVLRYKALERSADNAGVESKREIQQEVKEVPTTFKLNITSPVTEPVQTSLLDAAKEVVPEQKAPEPPKAESSNIPTTAQHAFQAEVSLNERISQNQARVSIADKLSKKPIADLRTAIGLNQKFLFMNDLFDGENQAFNEAVQQLNSQSNLDDAKNILLSLGTKYEWDLEAASVIEFTNLVERRYA